MILICATASRQENCLRGGTASIKGLKNGWRVERGFTCMSVWAEVIRTVSQVEQSVLRATLRRCLILRVTLTKSRLRG
jgi:hypothetical protein